MKYFTKKLILFTLLATVASPGLVAMPKNGTGEHLAGTKSYRKYGCWGSLIEKHKKAKNILEAFYALPEDKRPHKPAYWPKAKYNNGKDTQEFYWGLPEHLRPVQPITWPLIGHENLDEILGFLHILPKNLHPKKPIRWYQLKRKNAAETIKFFNGLPKNLHPQERITWRLIRYPNVEDSIKFFNFLPENLRPQKPYEWYLFKYGDNEKFDNFLKDNFHPRKRKKWEQLEEQSVAEILNSFYSLPDNERPRKPIKWEQLKRSSAAETIEFYNGLPIHRRPSKKRISWDLIQFADVEDSMEFFNFLRKELHFNDRISWHELGKWGIVDNKALKLYQNLPENFRPDGIAHRLALSWITGSLEETNLFLKGIPKHCRPYGICKPPANADRNYEVWAKNICALDSSLRSLSYSDPRWSPEHENSISLLAPFFMGVKELRSDNMTKNEFETWVSLGQFDRAELLNICLEKRDFSKFTFFMSEGLDGEGLTNYLQNTWFPGGQWIGGDLERAIGHLRDMEEQTAASEALMQLLEVARREAEATRQAPRPLEKRLPQIRNQTVHASKTESHYENAFKALQKQYPNPAPLGALTFEGVCTSLDRLTPEEREDALSQFNRLQSRAAERERINLVWAAVSSLNDSDAVLSFIKGGFVGPWRMYWEMKPEAEKAYETQRAGGEAAIQANIRQGSYNACLGGSRTMLVEALSGIHPDVPLSASKEDIYNALLIQVPSFIEQMKKRGEDVSQFWALFRKENLSSESHVAAHEAFKQLNVDMTDELLEGFFEEAAEN
ncbi:MAG: hypothetical protein ACRCUQ_03745 [Alphaproteobacteria bacterium]